MVEVAGQVCACGCGGLVSGSYWNSKTKKMTNRKLIKNHKIYGRRPWNKDLSKDTDPRIKKGSEKGQNTKKQNKISVKGADPNFICACGCGGIGIKRKRYVHGEMIESRYLQGHHQKVYKLSPNKGKRGKISPLKGKKLGTYEQMYGEQHAKELKEQKSKERKGIPLTEYYGTEKANEIIKKISNTVTEIYKTEDGENIKAAIRKAQTGRPSNKKDKTLEEAYGEEKGKETRKKMSHSRIEGIAKGTVKVNHHPLKWVAFHEKIRMLHSNVGQTNFIGHNFVGIYKTTPIGNLDKIRFVEDMTLPLQQAFRYIHEGRINKLMLIGSPPQDKSRGSRTEVS